MSVQRSLGNAWRAAWVLAGALLVFTGAAASGDTLTSGQVDARISAALLGPPDVLDSAIVGIFESAPAHEAGQLAANILAAAVDATAVQKAAIGKALAMHASALANEGHQDAARAIVTAIEKAEARRDRFVLRVDSKIESRLPVGLAIPLPTGPVPGSITPEIQSPAE